MSDRKNALISEIKSSESIAEVMNMELGEFAKDKDVARELSLALAKFAGLDTSVEKKSTKRTAKDKQYKLVSFDVKWATQSQVHAIAALLKSNFAEGQIVHESEILALVTDEKFERNVLRTQQGGQKVWNYYKGDHERGFRAHGNIELIGETKESN